MNNFLALSNIKLFWQEVASHCESDSLVHPSLGHPLEVKLLQSKEAKKIGSEFIERAKYFERNANLYSEKQKLIDVMSSMKSGMKNDLKATPFANLMELSEGVEQEFENSYFQWLALAEINRKMINNVEYALNGLNLRQMEISEMKTDKLVTALQSEAIMSKYFR